jgi:hypothetical protein
VNWINVFDQLMELIGEPLSSSCQLNGDSRLTPESVTAVPGGPDGGLARYRVGMSKVASFLPM